MTDASPEQRLAQRLLAGVEHLREGRAEDAVEPLVDVCDDPSLAEAEDLADVRLRAHSLLTQALLEVHRPAEARPRLAVAERLATDLGDRDAMRVLADLRGQLGAAEAAIAAEAHRTRQSKHLASLSLEDVLERVKSTDALADVLVRKANADADVGKHVEALPIAERALAHAVQAENPRAEVLARLSIARVAPDQAQAQVLAAHECADRSGETGLVTAVAKAADLHDVALPTEPGGGKPL